MFCSKCGAQNPDNADFCFKCGNSLTPVQPINVVKAPLSTRGEIGTEKEVILHRILVVIIDYIVLVIISFVVLGASIAPGIAAAGRIYKWFLYELTFYNSSLDILRHNI